MYMLNTLPGGDPSQAPSFLLPPPGLNYIAAIQPSLTFVMIQISFGSMLIPLLTALICLSTREIRKKPVFYFNILAILSGLVSCTLSIWLQVDAIILPLKPVNKHTLLATSVFAEFIPIFVESILFCRLLAVYPLHSTSRMVLVAVFTPPILLKIARVTNIIVTTIQIAHTFFNTPSVLQATEEPWQVFGTKIEFSLQVVDNAYMSILFLHKVWTMGKRARRFNLAGRVNGSKFYTLFWLASSNFVFPVLLSLAQFILLFADPAYTKETFMAILFFVNGIVEIICALLATLWVAGNRSTSSDAFEHRLSSHAKDIPQAAQDGTIMVPAMSDRQLRFSSLGPL